MADSFSFLCLCFSVQVRNFVIGIQLFFLIVYLKKITDARMNLFQQFVFNCYWCTVFKVQIRNYMSLSFMSLSLTLLDYLISLLQWLKQVKKLQLCLGDVYRRNAQEWINKFKWRVKYEPVVICDGCMESMNQRHIVKFLMFCSNWTVFLKSIDAF